MAAAQRQQAPRQQGSSKDVWNGLSIQQQHVAGVQGGHARGVMGGNGGAAQQRQHSNGSSSNQHSAPIDLVKLHAPARATCAQH